MAAAEKGGRINEVMFLRSWEGRRSKGKSEGVKLEFPA